MYATTETTKVQKAIRHEFDKDVEGDKLDDQRMGEVKERHKKWDIRLFQRHFTRTNKNQRKFRCA